MSIRTEFLRRTALLLLASASAWAQAKPLAVITLDENRYALERAGAGMEAKPVESAQAGKPYRADVPLSRAVRGAERIFVLGNRSFEKEGHRYFVLAVSKPSTDSNGRGYCGAGHEDRLLLVEQVATARALKLRDDLLVQSCLQSITLASDQGNELDVVLRGVTEPEPLQLSWLTHPRHEGQTLRFTVQAGKWKPL